MHRKFIATVAAVSILFTGFTAAPARANQDDFGRALAALLGVAIVGAVIHDNKKNKKERARVQQKPVHKKKKIIKQSHRVKPRPLPQRVKPRPLPRRVSEHLLPGRCLRSFETRRGNTAQMFGQRCLQQNYDFTNRLPQRCERRVRTDRGVRVGYGARCLRNQGYQLARR